MAMTHIGDRTAALLLAGLLLGVGCMAYGSGPPTVAIADLDSMDDGAVVKVRGVLVHAWRYDSGLENMILADLEDGSTVKLTHQSAASAAFTSVLSIGDEVSVLGEVRHAGGSLTLWVASGDLLLLRQSDAVLSVSAVCENWQLFEGDSLNIRGVVCEVDGDIALSDADGQSRIALFDAPYGLWQLVGTAVVLECRLTLSTEELRFGLEVSSFSVP